MTGVRRVTVPDVRDGHELMVVVVPEDVHERLTSKALRAGMTVDQFVARALRSLAHHRAR